MSLASVTRSLLTTIMVVIPLLVVAPTAQADCEFQGSQRAGSIECIDWAAQQTPGSAQSTGSEHAQDADGTTTTDEVDLAGPSDQSGGNTSAPTCRDSQERVVPCTTESQNGNQCFFSGAIAPPPSGSGGGVVYYCPPPTPSDDDAVGNPAPVSGVPPSAPPVDPVVVVWRAVASMDLHAIDMQIAPAPLSADADSMGLVGLPVWLWTEPTDSSWGPITASANDGPVSVTLTARVDRVEWNMGDGTRVMCETPGTPFDPARHGVDDHSPDCGHVYQHVSRDPSGAYTVTATSYWIAEWSSGDQSGAIPFDFTTTEQVRIGELQALRTSDRN